MACWQRVGRLDRFEKLQAVYDFRLEAARDLVAKMIGDRSRVSVTIGEVRAGRFRVYKTYGAMSDVLDDLGFSKPEIIENIDGERLDLSPEQVRAINADFLVSSYAEQFRAPPEDIHTSWDALVPGWDTVLHAPRHNQHILIVREPMRALSFQSTQEVLAVYVANIVTRNFVPLGKWPKAKPENRTYTALRSLSRGAHCTSQLRARTIFDQGSTQRQNIATTDVF